MPAKKKVRYAVIGQGYFAQIAILPAFAKAKKNSELVALVSDDPIKLEALGQEYGVTRLIGYDDVDELLGSGAVDAVYIALPNSMHREYTERAARHGVHVLCEKPLGVTCEDAEAMVKACAEGGVKLMTAYRLHFEEANLRAVEIVTSGQLGEPRFFSSVFGMNVKEGNIRLDRDLGGGPLWDIGIYCINAARYLFRAEPLEVFGVGASRSDGRFREVHEQVAATLRFPDDRLASFTVSFGSADVSAYDVVGTKGSLHVEPAYEFAGDLKHVLRVEGKETRKTFKKRDQVAPELIYFSRCILEDREPEPSGREGLADLRVIEALYASVKTGVPVKLEPFDTQPRPSIEQEDHAPASEEPELVNTEQPSP